MIQIFLLLFIYLSSVSFHLLHTSYPEFVSHSFTTLTFTVRMIYAEPSASILSFLLLALYNTSELWLLKERGSF